MINLVAIISDYGLNDHYVGTVHGVIKSTSPETQIVDITHSVRPFDVVDAALKLGWSFKYFPMGTVFLCLVDPDPEVEPVIVSTENYFVVCPNNGVGSLMFEEEPPEALYRITADHYFLKKESYGNFRGRDQLTPIAAELSRLQSASYLGEKVDLKLLKRFRLPEPKPLENGIYEAIVIDVDRFGNLILNAKLDSRTPRGAEVNGVKVGKFQTSFSNLKRGELFLSVNPENHLQVVAYMASAASLLKANRGMKVKLFY